MKNQFKIIFFSIIFLNLLANAVTIDWTGQYRFEYTEIDKTTLADPNLRKNLLLQSLLLKPQIIANDGVEIKGKFNILTNDQYPDAQTGQLLGRGPTKGASSTSNQDSSVMSDNQQSSNLQVQQLYLHLKQEYGNVFVGRMALPFGLGITHTSGEGLFDHWYDTHDVLAYQFFIGNLAITPVIGKVYDYSAGQGRSANDMIWKFEYDNPESKSKLGVFHQTRTSSQIANDAPFAKYGSTTSPGTSIISGVNIQTINVHISRGFETFQFDVEAGFQSGTTGIQAGSDEVKLSGFGVATESKFLKTEGSNWDWNLRVGMATGDNPNTVNFEGFFFDRNYDLTMLMFNHPLGSYDVLRTGAQRNSARTGYTATSAGTYSSDEALDEETISNVVYVSPKFNYTINDRWDYTGSLTWAQLQTNPAPSFSPGTDLGFEINTGFNYKPYKNVNWISEVGALFPGSAWAGGTANYRKDFVLGLSSKAAISF